jgi:hypothetical protein
MLVWAMAMLICGPAMAQAKRRIHKGADVPRFSYSVKGSLESLGTSVVRSGGKRKY